MHKIILITEDEVQVLKLLSRRLSEEGFDIEKANDGNSGLSLALKTHPDLILLDIVIPKMDGLTMLKELRKDDWGKSVPVIILTNLSDAERINDALSHGVYDFLIKSDWKLDEIVTKIKTRLK